MSVVLSVIGILYGLVGLSSLVALAIYLAYGPSIHTLSGQDVIFHLLFLGIPLLNALVGIALLYAFCAHRGWGRWLAITFNSIYLATIAYETLSAQLKNPHWVPLPATAFWLALGAMLGAVILVCLQRDAVSLMSK